MLEKVVGGGVCVCRDVVCKKVSKWRNASGDGQIVGTHIPETDGLVPAQAERLPSDLEKRLILLGTPCLPISKDSRPARQSRRHSDATRSFCSMCLTEKSGSILRTKSCVDDIKCTEKELARMQRVSDYF